MRILLLLSACVCQAAYINLPVTISNYPVTNIYDLTIGHPTVLPGDVLIRGTVFFGLNDGDTLALLVFKDDKRFNFNTGSGYRKDKTSPFDYTINNVPEGEYELRCDIPLSDGRQTILPFTVAAQTIPEPASFLLILPALGLLRLFGKTTA